MIRHFLSSLEALDRERAMQQESSATARREFEPQQLAATSQPRAQALSISIVSASRLLCEGLLTLLPAYIDLLSIRHYEAGLAQPQTIPPGEHVVLLDSNLGVAEARAWAHHWQSSRPPAKVLAIDVADDVQTILAFIEAGAVAYTLRGASVHDVANAVSWLVNGKVHSSPEVVALLISRASALGALAPSQPRKVPSPGLTPREQEVLACLVKGYGNREIAAELFIEVRTVKHHVHNLLEKLRLRHRYEAARLALEQGWPVAG